MANNIERIAIDQTGTLRSFYDGCQEIIRGKFVDDFLTSASLCDEVPICLLIKGRTPESQNLLQMIRIDYELRLSIYLKMVPTNGVASLIHYPRRIDEQTRFIYLYQKTYTESCQEDLEKLSISSLSKTSVTHIIGEISWGINVVVVLQLPSDQSVKIDTILEKICYSLTDYSSTMEIDSDEKDLLNTIISTTIYSNIYQLTQLTKLQDVYAQLFKWKKNTKEHQRLNYTLCPIPILYPQCTGKRNRFIPVDPAVAEVLEYHLLQQLAELRIINLRLNHELSELLQEKLDAQLKDARNKLSEINKLQEEQLHQIRDLVVEVRKGASSSDSINDLMETYAQAPIKDSIQRLITTLDELQAKGKLLKGLQDKGFKYCNVNELGIEKGYSERLIRDIIFGTDTRKAILCSTDKFRSDDKDDWNEKRDEIIKKHEEDPNLNLVYADFTYSTYILKKTIILTSTESPTNNDHSNPQRSQNNVQKKVPLSPLSSSTSSDDFINILLIGESGVGKSTFVNAFANYLRFKSLTEAQQGDPVVIIPVSFVMTINNDFDERVIEFGETDSNENHNDSGQSVTQQCKCYVFNISAKKKLRIIDTPGFGDTRGSEQDDFNMEEIFSFLNNLTYLNGICLLFKPEVVQLNPYFRSCCTQLFDYFGENIRDYIIFCFTNARSTFYAPGNTRPLLQTFFESFSVKNIPFGKGNTFCFDSESFRYLIALQRRVKFDEDERDDFEQSWSKSANESKRFRDFLCNQNAYRKNNKWQSVKDAQFQINSMIRPMLEGIRNLQRNILLSDFNSSINLRATHLKRSIMLCYKCERTPKLFGQFWILLDHLHKSSDTVSLQSFFRIFENKNVTRIVVASATLEIEFVFFLLERFF